MKKIFCLFLLTMSVTISGLGLTGCGKEQNTNNFNVVYQGLENVKGRQITQGEYTALKENVSKVKDTSRDIEIYELIKNSGIELFTTKQEDFATAYLGLLEENRDILTEQSRDYLNLRDSLTIDDSLTAQETLDNLVLAIKTKNTRKLKVPSRYVDIASATYAVKFGLLNDVPYYDALAYLSKAEKENDTEMREAFTKVSKEQREIIVSTTLRENED